MSEIGDFLVKLVKLVGQWTSGVNWRGGGAPTIFIGLVPGRPDRRTTGAGHINMPIYSQESYFCRNTAPPPRRISIILGS
jgi:hypothetical protein